VETEICKLSDKHFGDKIKNSFPIQRVNSHVKFRINLLQIREKLKV
jgi:hypothetical protein